MKKILLVAIVVLLVGAGIGCAVDAPATPATSPFSTIAYVDQKDAAEAAARTAADTVLANADTAIKNSVTELNTKVTGSTSGYTKAEVDAFLKTKQDSIDALTTKLNQWTTGNLPNPNQQPQQNPPLITTGQVTGVMSPLTVSAWGNGTNIGFVYRITNGTNQWQYCKPAFVFSAPSPYAAINIGGILINMQQGSFLWSSTNFDYLPALSTTPRASFDVVPMTGGENSLGERFLAPNAWVDINVNIAINSTPTTALWTISANVRSHP